MAETGRSPWFYILAGCGGLLVLGGIAIAVFAFLGWRWAQDFQATMKDPDRRAAAVMERLGATTLPDGWRPGVAIDAPLGLGEFALLTTGDAVPAGNDFDLGDRGFLFVRAPGGRIEEARERFERGGDLTGALESPGANFDVDREIARGTFETRGGLVLWLSGAGSTRFQGEAREGLTTVGLLDCDADEKSRYVIWFGGDVVGDPEDPVARVGTIADPDVLRSFLGHFRLCPE
jgi:hypothetical protein